MVSVPYRGSIFPNEFKAMNKKEEQFPSPIGVLFFQIQPKADDQKSEQPLFPSPIGVLFFQIKQEVYLWKRSRKSFRPLSGFYFSK